MTPEEKKTIQGALRQETALMISLCTDNRLEHINQNDIELRNFFIEIWERAQRRLHQEGHASVIERQNLEGYDPYQQIRSMIGNMEQAFTDLGQYLPPGVLIERLVFWDKLWRTERAKSNRAKAGDVDRLSKRVRRDQDAIAAPGGREDISGAGTSMRTAYNARVAHILGIPHEPLIMGSRIGSGSFGECRKVTVKGISFLPEHITYCAKCYKGDEDS